MIKNNLMGWWIIYSNRFRNIHNYPSLSRYLTLYIKNKKRQTDDTKSQREDGGRNMCKNGNFWKIKRFSPGVLEVLFCWDLVVGGGGDVGFFFFSIILKLILDLLPPEL